MIQKSFFYLWYILHITWEQCYWGSQVYFKIPEGCWFSVLKCRNPDSNGLNNSFSLIRNNQKKTLSASYVKFSHSRGGFFIWWALFFSTLVFCCCCWLWFVSVFFSVVWFFFQIYLWSIYEAKNSRDVFIGWWISLSSHYDSPWRHVDSSGWKCKSDFCSDPYIPHTDCT